MINLYEVFDNEHKKMLNKYNIEIKNTLLTEEEYLLFLKEINKMSIKDMEDIYDFLDDYFAKEE